MDPITAALVAALPALASDLMKSSVKDAYEGLKAVIRRRWGAASRVAKAVDAFEADPSSKGRAAVLQEEIADVKATHDAELMKALAELVTRLRDAGIRGEAASDINITVSGGSVTGVVGAQRVIADTMSFGAPIRNDKA